MQNVHQANTFAANQTTPAAKPTPEKPAAEVKASPVAQNTEEPNPHVNAGRGTHLHIKSAAQEFEQWAAQTQSLEGLDPEMVARLKCAFCCGMVVALEQQMEVSVAINRITFGETIREAQKQVKERIQANKQRGQEATPPAPESAPVPTEEEALAASPEQPAKIVLPNPAAVAAQPPQAN